MNVHQNARLTPFGRERRVGMIADRMAFLQVGERFQHEGQKGLHDRNARRGLCAIRRLMMPQSGSFRCAVTA